MNVRQFATVAHQDEHVTYKTAQANVLFLAFRSTEQLSDQISAALLTETCFKVTRVETGHPE